MATVDKQLDIHRRIHNSFTNLKKLGKANMTQGSCPMRMQQLKDLWNKFDSNYEILLDNAETEFDDNYFITDVYSKAEEDYLTNLGSYQDHLLSLNTIVPGTGTSSNSNTLVTDSSTLNHTKIPQIELPIFDGNIKDWVRSRDTFTEMIVKRTNLPNVFKIHFLKTNLKGKAAELLDEIPPSTIKNFYNYTRLLITKLLSKLISMKNMNNGSAHELNRVRSGTKNILQASKALGSPVESWDHFTVFLTVSKLSPHIQRKWEEQVAK